MAEVPAELQGRYARSLAALAVIAARADALTHRDLGALLVARRDRRIERLQRLR
jgi:RNA processing factor Prp31